ncbi:PadR family transcriptional regulator [Bacillus sp. SB49]|uniref:PadR family transcriptional regulator n=1 Tax=Bacillus sp. SB49 TaxID=1071080 RepID=UPI0004239A8C|nr:PadR family transcriptional regulator [Bacillus sp. SB49]QHT46183.1 PadR family transcriptional regulator [Bacillus sp. SB49]
MARNDALDAGELTDTSFYILLSLLEARHGYLIMQTIEEWTEGEFTIGPASLYTTIKKLLKAELIELAEGSGKKKTYIATAAGRELLKSDVERRRRMIRHAEEVWQEKEDVINEA